MNEYRAGQTLFVTDKTAIHPRSLSGPVIFGRLLNSTGTMHAAPVFGAHAGTTIMYGSGGWTIKPYCFSDGDRVRVPEDATLHGRNAVYFDHETVGTVVDYHDDYCLVSAINARGEKLEQNVDTHCLTLVDPEKVPLTTASSKVTSDERVTLGADAQWEEGDLVSFLVTGRIIGSTVRVGCKSFTLGALRESELVTVQHVVNVTMNALTLEIDAGEVTFRVKDAVVNEFGVLNFTGLAVPVSRAELCGYASDIVVTRVKPAEQKYKPGELWCRQAEAVQIMYRILDDGTIHALQLDGSKSYTTRGWTPDEFDSLFSNVKRVYSPVTGLDS